MPLFELTCTRCGTTAERVSCYVAPGASVVRECYACGEQSEHKRMGLEATALYLADRPRTPMIAGGSCDTMGAEKNPLPYPEFPEDTPLGEKYNSPEWKAYEEMQNAVNSRNMAKRERARLIKAGANIDIKHHPLPGDPKGIF